MRDGCAAATHRRTRFTQAPSVRGSHLSSGRQDDAESGRASCDTIAYELIRELQASGLLATCLQHEIEHLDGILFVDHLSMVKRGIILRKLAKAKRSREPVPA